LNPVVVAAHIGQHHCQQVSEKMLAKKLVSRPNLGYLAR
jgi:hypothetical protein